MTRPESHETGEWKVGYRSFRWALLPVLLVLIVVGAILVNLRLEHREEVRRSPDHLYRLAGMAWRNGNLSRAEDLFRRVLESRPDSASAAYFVSLAELRTGRREEALERLASIAEHSPSHYETRELLARVLFESAELDEALRHARAAVALRPKESSAWLLLARVSARADQPVEAVSAYRRALALDPDLLAPCLELAEACRAAIRRAPGSPELSPSRAFEDGERRALDLIEERGESPARITVLISCILPRMVGREADLEHWMDRLLAVAPDDPAAWQTAVRTLRALKKEEELIELLARATERFPGESRFVLAAAGHEADRGNEAGAEALLGRGIEAADRKNRGPLLVARGRLRLAAGDHAAAVGDLIDARDQGAPADLVDPLILEAHTLALVAAGNRGDASSPKEVEAVLAEAVALTARRPSDRRLRALRGRLRVLAGEYGSAVADLEPIVAEGTSDPEDLFFFGSAKLARGESGAAAELLDAALRGRAVPLGRLAVLAEAFARGGRKEDARRVLDELSKRGLAAADRQRILARWARSSGEDPLPHLLRALALRPDPGVALEIALLRRERGIPDADRVLVDPIGKGPAWIAARARFCAAAGDLDRALDVLDELPGPSALRSRERALAFLATGDPASAERELAAAPGAEASPVRSLARARVLISKNRYAEAAAELRSAVDRGLSTRAVRVELAATLARAGDYEGAAADLSSLLRENPDDPESERLLAGVATARAGALLSSGDEPGALDVLGAAASRVSTPLPDLQAAAVRLRAGDLHGALAGLRSAAEKRPDEPRYRVQLARYLLRASRFLEALEVLDALPGEPDAVRRHLRGLALAGRGRKAEAAAELSRTLDLDPRDLAARAAICTFLIEEGAEDRAVETAAEGVAAAPDDADAAMLSARVLLMAGRDRDAVDALNRVTEADPDRLDAVRLLVAAASRTDRLPETVARLRGLVKRRPRSRSHRLYLALAREASGDEAGADEDFRRAADLTGGPRETTFLLASHLIRHGRGAAAVRILESELASEPDDPDGLTLLGAALESESRLGGAREAYERVLDLRPDSPLAANNLALLLGRDAKTLPRAVRLARTAVRSTRGAPWAVDTSGWLRYLSGDVGGAVEELSAAVESDGAVPLHRYHLGVASMATDPGAARKQLEAALAAGLPPAEARHAGDVLAAMGGSGDRR